MPRAIIERPSQNFSGRGSATIDCVVIHDSGCREAEPTLSWFASPGSRMSAHYVIDRDGTIYRCVDDQDGAWHAGDSVMDGCADVNACSIGIKLVGFASTAYRPAQIDALVELCLSLCVRYKIALERIVGHEAIALPAGRKRDPGPHFPWQEVRGRVAMGLAASVA
jgi:N-acetylmuramoyl-L-alanine amidase